MVAKKKHKLKKKVPLPHIEGSFYILGCDLSMRCPGFALVYYNADTRSVEIVKKSIVFNGKAKVKTHGRILGEISRELSKYLNIVDVKVVVRERAFSRFNNEVQTLNKVVGISEMILWHFMRCEFQELTPSQIKKNVTGNGSATKEEVAEAIDNYCNHDSFESDDESDACGAAIGWLVINDYLDIKPLKKYADVAETKGDDNE